MRGYAEARRFKVNISRVGWHDLPWTHLQRLSFPTCYQSNQHSYDDNSACCESQQLFWIEIGIVWFVSDLELCELIARLLLVLFHRNVIQSRMNVSIWNYYCSCVVFIWAIFLSWICVERLLFVKSRGERGGHHIIESVINDRCNRIEETERRKMSIISVHRRCIHGKLWTIWV